MRGSRLPVWARVVIALVFYVGLTLLMEGAMVFLLDKLLPPFFPGMRQARSVAPFLATGALAGVLTVVLLARLRGPRSWASLVGGRGVARFALTLAVGLLLGAGLGSILALVLLGGGGSWGPATPFYFFSRSWSLLLAALFAAAFAEELFFRGYLHALLRERLSLPGSALVGGGLFALVHLFNPGASLLPAINIFLAGVLLALLRERSGSLAAPIGWHAGWNMTLGMLYGLPVSGVHLISLFRIEVFDLPAWMGGGAFGPEGSLPCTVLLLGLLLGSGRKLMTAQNRELPETL